MLKRSILLSSPIRLSVRNLQLILSDINDGMTISSIPIEDLAHVIVENQRCQLTIPALNELARQNVGVIFCDDKAMPHAMTFPLEGNTLQGQRYRAQLEAPLPVKKSIWQQIIIAKIQNQSRLLHKHGKDGDILKPLYKNVKSDDADNREGIAARIYWQQLFGKGFIRSREGQSPNALLNYGYTILRAATTRAIVAAGLLPALGIHHHNRSNAFPLADDLMEPFRPFVDDIVYEQYLNHATTLDTTSKQQLINVLYCDTMVGNHKHPISVALEMICTSLIKVMTKESKQLHLPTFNQ